MYLHYFTKNKTDPFFIHFAEHDTDFAMHTHVDFSELVIILGGTAMHVVDNEEFFIKKGDVFVISNETSHSYRDTHDFKLCNIMFLPEKINDNLKDIRKQAGFHALFVIEPYLSHEHQFTSRLSLSPVDFLTANLLIETMMEEYYSHHSGRTDMLYALFTQLAVFLSRKYSFDDTNTPHSLINIASSVSYIETHFTQSISIDELAALSNLSPRHFTRRFKETYGVTPKSYLINLRLDFACHLLQHNRSSITEAALLSGFSDINYFSRIFKKHRHMTPRDYKRYHDRLPDSFASSIK